MYKSGLISNGFKSGGFNGANSNTTQQLKPYKEEVLTSYEAGIKATLLEGRMQLNAAAFFYDYKDKQEQDAAVTFVGNISGLTNVPKSEIMGAELDMQWVPAEGWNVNLGLAYLDTEVTEWEAVDRDASSWPVTVTHDVSGIELAMAPRWSAAGLVSYQWSVGNNLVMDSYQGSISLDPSLYINNHRVPTATNNKLFLLAIDYFNWLSRLFR